MKYLVSISLAILVTVTAGSFIKVEATGWFDQYGAIPWAEERAHLDNFAVYLRKDRDMIGYVGICLNKPLSAREARKRKANQIMTYLTGPRLQVLASRIKIIDRGRCKETDIILQPTDKNVEPLKFPKNT